MVKHWIVCLSFGELLERTTPILPQKPPSYYYKDKVVHPSEVVDRLMTAFYLCLVLSSHFAAVKKRSSFPLLWNLSEKNSVFNFLLLLTANPPWSVDPDDSNVAEKNALLVFLILTRAALLSPVGCVGELHQGALLRCGACNREGRSWKVQMEEVS